MGYYESLEGILSEIPVRLQSKTNHLERIRTEIDFAGKLIKLHPDKAKEWQALILKAAEILRDGIPTSGVVDIASVAARAEEVLAPIGKVAKEYTIHCCAHAHIDMNWIWPWQDTISVTHDTFSTIDRLMDEFPDFHFSQSQASCYEAMEEYCPEVFKMLQKRVAEGRWEVTASMWVEGDKNLSSGESLCRHMLLTRGYMKEKFGLPYDAVKIDWECDAFGHAHTLPSILNRGGVTRYYRMRTRPDHWLIWWKAPDGSKVLAFHDKAEYNGPIAPKMNDYLIDYVQDTGLKDFLWIYGVGDHGGGPTRRDLMTAADYANWPIWPKVKLTTTDDYFSIVEKMADHIPVLDDELNFIFEGCYTTQCNIKHANRVSENVLPEAEAISLVAGAETGFPYPADLLRKGWRNALFNQFHDILPGSGVKDTYHYAQGLFQDAMAVTGSVKTRALRRLALAVDTTKPFGLVAPKGKGGASIGDGMGAGAGDSTIPGGFSAYSGGAVDAEPILVFNALPFARSEIVETKLWNKVLPADRIVVRDEHGNETPAQVVKTGNYWGHNYTQILFPATDIPATGYKTFTVSTAGAPVETEGVTLLPSEKVAPFRPDWMEIQPPYVLENEFVRVELDCASGGIKSLVDKATGYEMVPKGGLLGLLEVCHEAPGGMAAWEIGQITRVTPLSSDGKLTLVSRGPHRAAFSTSRKWKDSTISVEVALSAGSPMVEFIVTVNWLEIGTMETGVPQLRITFPVNAGDPKATYEIPFGSKERPVNGREVPALKWADLSGSRVGAKGSCGITLVNADKYGHSADESTLRLTLLRSPFDPDPLPDMGNHVIRMAILPHDGMCPVSKSCRAGAAFNLPMSVVNTDVHEGTLPPSKGFAEVLTPNVMLAGLKKAEDSDSVIVRMYETEGKETVAKIRLSDIVKKGAKALEVDIMEQPLSSSSARMDGDTLSVKIPAHGIATVAVK